MRKTSKIDFLLYFHLFPTLANVDNLQTLILDKSEEEDDPKEYNKDDKDTNLNAITVGPKYETKPPPLNDQDITSANIINILQLNSLHLQVSFTFDHLTGVKLKSH